MENNTIKPKVLLVDDVPENIQILMETLKDEYTIIAATNGEKALNLALVDPMPDIILLDIMMPEMDGYEVCQRLKADEKTKDIPVIFVTAMQEVEDEKIGFDVGAVDYITKPVSPPIVRARVKNHLALEFARRTLEEQNQELREAARLREDVEKITRHDLKSPLNMIIGGPQAIMTFGEVNEKQQKYLGYIEETGYRMLEMINRTLDLFKMERGLYECKFEQIDVVDILKKVVTETQSLCAMNNVKITVFIDGKALAKEDAFFIPGEQLLFFPMLENLIKNAIEASPEGAQVGVFLNKDDSFRIKIQNEGAVPVAIRDKFFDKYVTSDKEKGTGLGTYSAKLVAETMNGNISMVSSEKEGTAITLKFPIG
jgi:CheY-like chemotaxis protein